MSTPQTNIGTDQRRRRKSPPQSFPLINADVRCEFRRISKHKLVIPTEDYQRDESEGRIAAEIAQNFDIVAFGCLTVIQSMTGHLRVLDGGTRLSAALKRDDVDELPCLVYSGLTLDREAEAFLRINEARRRLQIWQLQHAEVAAQRTLALVAQDYLDRLEKHRIGIHGLRILRRMIKAHSTETATIIDLLLITATDKHITGRVLHGLVLLEHFLNDEGKTLNKRATIAKMQKNFGNMEVSVNAVVTTHKRTDGKSFARAVAKALGVRMPKGVV